MTHVNNNNNNNNNNKHSAKPNGESKSLKDERKKERKET